MPWDMNIPCGGVRRTDRRQFQHVWSRVASRETVGQTARAESLLSFGAFAFGSPVASAASFWILFHARMCFCETRKARQKSCNQILTRVRFVCRKPKRDEQSALCVFVFFLKPYPTNVAPEWFLKKEWTVGLTES